MKGKLPKTNHIPSSGHHMPKSQNAKEQGEISKNDEKNVYPNLENKLDYFWKERDEKNQEWFLEPVAEFSNQNLAKFPISGTIPE